VKAWIVARKTLIETLREPQLLGLTLALPVIFVLITALTYSATLLPTYAILFEGAGPEADTLRADLAAERYADGRPVFDLISAPAPEAAEDALKGHDAVALLTIGPGPDATIRGDAIYMRFIRASTLLEQAINRHADRAAGRAEIVRVAQQPLYPSGPLTEFDLYAPGMMVFALLLLIPQTALLVAREARQGTLSRLRLTPLSAGAFLAGVSGAQFAIAVVQVVLVFGSALAFGFHNRGSLPLAILVGLAICLGAIGQGLVVAAFVENDSQATNLGSTVAMLQVFLSGAFYQMPPITLFTLAGHPIDLFDVFPATHGFLALQGVLTFGAGLPEIGFRLMLGFILAGLYFGAGVLVFRRLQMRPAGS
jgi:ABC-2 type transport system permease protein